MQLQRYFERIKYDGAVEPSVATLASLQEKHVLSVPFENLDVQLGRRLSTRVEDAYEKIVIGARGGWCYEQNGLFGWALSELGFDVTRISASVMRDQRGEASTASHLCLIVKCPESNTKYLADVGFGGSMIRPIALTESQHKQSPFALGLDRPDGHYWRFWENLGDGKVTFDFTEEAACERSLAEKSTFLQTDSSSNFVMNLVAQQRTRDQHRMLRGRVFSVAKPGARESRILDSPEALVAILASEFRLDVPEVAGLWPKIAERHDQLFGHRSV